MKTTMRNQHDAVVKTQNGILARLKAIENKGTAANLTANLTGNDSDVLEDDVAALVAASHDVPAPTFGGGATTDKTNEWINELGLPWAHATMCPTVMAVPETNRLVENLLQNSVPASSQTIFINKALEMFFTKKALRTLYISPNKG